MGLRYPSTPKSRLYESAQLLEISRCATSEILFHLCPDKLHRIEFRCAGREVVNMDTRMLSQKPLYCLALMNRRFVPPQHDGTAYPSQQMLQEFNDLVAGQITLVRPGTPADFASAGRDQQRTNRIDPLVVMNYSRGKPRGILHQVRTRVRGKPRGIYPTRLK